MEQQLPSKLLTRYLCSCIFTGAVEPVDSIHREICVYMGLIMCHVNLLFCMQVTCNLHVGGSRCDSDCVVELESQLRTLLQGIPWQTDRVIVLLFVFYVVRRDNWLADWPTITVMSVLELCLCVKFSVKTMNIVLLLTGCFKTYSQHFCFNFAPHAQPFYVQVSPYSLR